MSLFGTVAYLCYYSAEIAPVGHTDSQAPQSMQASVTSYFASPSTIAPAGQVDSQEPHFTHSSLITWPPYRKNGSANKKQCLIGREVYSVCLLLFAPYMGYPLLTVY